MSERFECGDADALVAYVYDECDPGLRETIAAHVTRCLSCSSEIEDLGWTRRRLQSWVPPVTELGFHMPASEQPARLAWWRAPLPAWAQAAAALLVFAAGLSIGMSRPVPVAAPPPPAAAAAIEPAASRTELSDLEERLRSEMAQLRAVPAPVRAAAVSEAEIMKQVELLLAESEERQRREFTLRSVDLARNIEAQRRVDMASVRETVGTLQGVTGAEIRQQREAIDRINSFIRVSQQGR